MNDRFAQPYIDEENLYVVTSITNPHRYASRVRLFREFAERMERTPNVKFYVIEGVLEGQEAQVFDPNNLHHRLVTLRDAIWHKENLLNVLINSLPPEAKYIAWVDADVTFVRPDWVGATIKALRDHPVVQMFSTCSDLDSHSNILAKEMGAHSVDGMIYRWHNNGNQRVTQGYHRHGGHCGYAWAIRRDVFEALEGLLDFSIVGSADYIMASAFMGHIMNAVDFPASFAYKEKVREWGRRWDRIDGVVGYIDGLVLHHFHGFKKERGYSWRNHEYVVKTGFNPDRDLKKNREGVYEWDRDSPACTQLKAGLATYFSLRNEDVPSDDRPVK